MFRVGRNKKRSDKRTKAGKAYVGSKDKSWEKNYLEEKMT
jgi:hypothetical protein